MANSVGLTVAVELLREVSRVGEPLELAKTFWLRMEQAMGVDRTVVVSRRGLTAPVYQVTRSDVWFEAGREISPWKEREKLPVYSGGILGDLLYAGNAQIVHELVGVESDPAAEHLLGMASLVAVPLFDEGEAVSMAMHMKKETRGFEPERFGELMLVSGLFGRAMRGLVLAEELRGAQQRLKEQYHAATELSDTILEQAVEIKRHAENLEDRVKERTRELEVANQDAIYMLAAAAEAKDDNTGEHVRRLQQLSYELAKKMGKNEEEAQRVGRAAILHDVGKIHVPDAILKKAGPLTNDERAIMQEHTLAGERILTERAYFGPARRVARSHHENWDGSGYPDGLKGKEIALEARIVHLVDVYDALTHARSYKAAWKEEEVMAYIEKEKGRMFDPEVVQAFVNGNGQG